MDSSFATSCYPSCYPYPYWCPSSSDDDDDDDKKKCCYPWLYGCDPEKTNAFPFFPPCAPSCPPCGPFAFNGGCPPCGPGAFANNGFWPSNFGNQEDHSSKLSFLTRLIGGSTFLEDVVNLSAAQISGANSFWACFSKPDKNKNFLKLLKPKAIKYIYKKVYTDGMPKTGSGTPQDILYNFVNALQDCTDKTNNPSRYCPIANIICKGDTFTAANAATTAGEVKGHGVNATALTAWAQTAAIKAKLDFNLFRVNSKDGVLSVRKILDKLNGTAAVVDATPAVLQRFNADGTTQLSYNRDLYTAFTAGGQPWAYYPSSGYEPSRAMTSYRPYYSSRYEESDNYFQ